MVYWKMKFVLVRWNLMNWLTWQLEELGLLSSDLGEHIWILAAIITILVEFSDGLTGATKPVRTRSIQYYWVKTEIRHSIIKMSWNVLFSFVRDFRTIFITRKSYLVKPDYIYLISSEYVLSFNADEYCRRFIDFYLLQCCRNNLELSSRRTK